MIIDVSSCSYFIYMAAFDMHIFYIIPAKASSHPEPDYDSCREYIAIAESKV
jgi:hypothetical protein